MILYPPRKNYRPSRDEASLARFLNNSILIHKKKFPNKDFFLLVKEITTSKRADFNLIVTVTFTSCLVKLEEFSDTVVEHMWEKNFELVDVKYDKTALDTDDVKLVNPLESSLWKKNPIPSFHAFQSSGSVLYPLRSNTIEMRFKYAKQRQNWTSYRFDRYPTAGKVKDKRVLHYRT